MLPIGGYRLPFRETTCCLAPDYPPQVCCYTAQAQEEGQPEGSAYAGAPSTATGAPTADGIKGTAGAGPGGASGGRGGARSGGAPSGGAGAGGSSGVSGGGWGKQVGR